MNNVYDKVKLNRLIQVPAPPPNVLGALGHFRSRMYLIRATILDSVVFRG